MNRAPEQPYISINLESMYIIQTKVTYVIVSLYKISTYTNTMIGRKNETDQLLLKIIWDIPILLSAINRAL